MPPVRRDASIKEIMKSLRVLLVTCCTILSCDAVQSLGPAIKIEGTLSLTVGSAATVAATVSDLRDRTLVFESRDSLVARVNQRGVVTGVRPGATYVVVASAVQPGVRDSVRIVVTSTRRPMVLPVLGSSGVFGRYVGRVAVSGKYAYTTTWGRRLPSVPGNAVHAWDVTGKIPIPIDSIILPDVGTASDIVLTDAGTLIVSADSSTNGRNGMFFMPVNQFNGLPLHPQAGWSSITSQPGVRGLELSHVGGRYYAFLSAGPWLIFVDITGSTALEVHAHDMGAAVNNAFVRDGVLFVALGDAGLRIFDIGGAAFGGTVKSPIELATIRTTPCGACPPGRSSVYDVWWFHDQIADERRYAFVVESQSSNVLALRSAGALHVIDVSNLRSPREVAFFEADSSTTSNGRSAGPRGLVVDETSGILYMAYQNGGVRALDVRGELDGCSAGQRTRGGLCDLSLMEREVAVSLTSGSPRFVYGLAHFGDVLYATDALRGLHKIDIRSLRR